MIQLLLMNYLCWPIIEKEKVINVSFFSFLRKYDNRKAHNIYFLMLDLKLKSLFIISSFVGKEQGVVLVEKYDKKSLYPMLIKCHEHLHPLVRSNRHFVNQDNFLLGLQFGYF